MGQLEDDFDRELDIRLKARQRLTEDIFSSAMGGVRGGGSFQSPSQGMAAAREQYRHNNGAVYSNTRPVANRLAAQPMCVGRIIRDEKSKGKCLKAHEIEALPKEVKQVAYGDNALGIEKLESHPLLDTLHDPNDLMTAWHLMVYTASSLQVTGKAYWLVLDSKRPGKKFDLWPVPAHWIERADRGGWKFMPDGESDAKWVPADRVVYFYDIDIANPFGAKGRLEANAQSVLTLESIVSSQKATFDNGIKPGTVVTVGDIENPKGGMTKPQLEHWQAIQIEERLNQMHRGTTKHNGIVILDGMITGVHPYTMKPMEMDYESSHRTTKKSVDQGFGVSPVVKGEDENANRAAALVAGETLNDNVMNPLITQIVQCVNGWLVPLFEDGDSIVFWIVLCTSKDPDQERANNQLLVDNGALTINELRAAYGKPPLTGGNAIVMPLAKIKIPVPDEDDPEMVEGSNTAETAIKILMAFRAGEISQEQAVQLFVNYLGMDESDAEVMVGDELPPPKPEPMLIGGPVAEVPEEPVEPEGEIEE